MSDSAGHQYVGGELCLEYRPDNWMPETTGADMIRSAHRLLSEEATSDAVEDAVPSAHSLSVGQQLRTQYWRFPLTTRSQCMLTEFVGTADASFFLWRRHKRIPCCLHKVTKPDGEWIDSEVPGPLDQVSWKSQGFVVGLVKGDPRIDEVL